MGIELVPATSEHVSELGRILYEAFKDVFDRHHIQAGFPSVSVARKSIGNYVERDDYFGLTAMADGDIAGSAFMLVSDEVGGVGPITVEVSLQGRSIGRMLMEGLIDYGHQNGMEQVRLLQDAVNVASVSLYTSLGFDARESVAFMQAAPRNDSEGLVRPMTEADLPAVEEISRRIYKVSRRNEVEVVLQENSPALLRERDGRLVGYLVPGTGGHGVAETDDDAVALIGESAERFPPEVARFFCPLGEAALYRKLLKAGCRATRLLNLMSMGPYDAPDEVWLPSILY